MFVCFLSSDVTVFVSVSVTIEYDTEHKPYSYLAENTRRLFDKTFAKGLLILLRNTLFTVLYIYITAHE